MKLPRWLLWNMLSLSVGATLAFAGWWWVSWPTITMRAFTNWPSEATQLILSPAVAEVLTIPERMYTVTNIELILIRPPSSQYIKPESRSLTEILIGRQSFTWDSEAGGDSFTEYVVVQRGLVVDVGVILDKRYSLLDEASY